MNKILYILFFTTLFSYGQNVVREGYWYAIQGDKQGVNRTSMAKAQGDTFEFFKQDPNTPIYIIPPYRFRVEFEKEVKPSVQFKVEGIETRELTNSKIELEISLNNTAEYLYIKFREQGTVDWLQTTIGKDLVIYDKPLKSNTTYEYIVYTEDVFGNKINSDIKTFKTL